MAFDEAKVLAKYRATQAYNKAANPGATQSFTNGLSDQANEDLFIQGQRLANFDDLYDKPAGTAATTTPASSPQQTPPAAATSPSSLNSLNASPANTSAKSPTFQIFRSPKPGEGRQAAETFSGTEAELEARKAQSKAQGDENDISYSAIGGQTSAPASAPEIAIGGGGGTAASAPPTAGPPTSSMDSLLGPPQQEAAGFTNIGASGSRPGLGTRILPEYSYALAALQRAVY